MFCKHGFNTRKKKKFVPDYVWLNFAIEIVLKYGQVYSFRKSSDKFDVNLQNK